jgi:hypothetical protein
MLDELKRRTQRYEELLRVALEDADFVVQKNDPLYGDALELYEMAKAYYSDGLFFLRNNEYVNAIVSFSYGHGFLDAGIRLGMFKRQG